jgi:hypothetical protein
MPGPADKNGVSLKDARQLIADEGFAISVLSAVVAAALLAFGFGATADIVISMLIVGVATAFAETWLRTRK